MKTLLLRCSVICAFFIAIASFSAPVAMAQAETSDFTLKLNKDFGFNDFDGSIEGTFSLVVNTNRSLNRIVIYANDSSIAELNAPPFKLQFNTSRFKPGIYTFRATGYTVDGQTLSSNIVKANIISAEESRQRTTNIILPLMGGIVVLVFIPIILMAISTMRQNKHQGYGTPISYSFLGGAICSHCGMPFSRHWWSLNFLTTRLDQCPHCNKWGFVSRATSQALRAAEDLAQKQASEGSFLPSPHNDLEKEIEDTRYRNE